jgi:hypothetical protein
MSIENVKTLVESAILIMNETRVIRNSEEGLFGVDEKSADG